MFKLESYVTSIILNHVAKYVKDIKPEDAQVSLWEGEVCFQNLELRLDVLEDELNLPIELKTGHIHDLTIQVPWTRITSEPIKILINTIEFVVKLRKDDGTPMQTRQKIEIKKEETDPAQQSMLMGMVNKMLNNINIEIQNIIFKFLDDDFVVSMNVQKLLVTAANEDWQPAVVDVNPVKVILRKLVQLSDLTICLDQLTEAGDIDVCHEPILYRCSLELRFLRKYHVNSVKTTSKTRIGILTKSLNVLLSSVQFPLTLKIIDLVMDIVSGEVKVKKLYEEETIESQVSEPDNSSYLSWAWNMLPSLSGPRTDDTDEGEPPGHLFDIGVYLESFNLTFKNSEYVHDAIVGGIKRIRYHPIVKVILGGLYLEQQSVPEREWFAFKAGVSKLCVEPLGPYKQGRTCANLLEGSVVREMNFNFKDKSLFDKNMKMNEKNWVFHTVADYNERISDSYLLYKSPVLAFDYIKFKEASSGYGQASTIESSSSSSASQSSPRQVQIRLLSSGLTFRYNQHLQQVKHIINDLLNNYKYSAYHAEKLGKGALKSAKRRSTTTTSTSSTSSSTSSSSISRSTEDLEYYINQMPRINYRLQFENLKIEMHPQTDPIYDLSKLSSANCQSILKESEKEKLPFFHIEIPLLKGSLNKLAELKSLGYIVSQLRDRPQFLDEGYEIYDVVIRDATLRFQYPEDGLGQKLAFFPHLDISYGIFSASEIWKDEKAPEEKLFIKCPLLNLSFSKQLLVYSYRLYQHIGTYKPSTLISLLKQGLKKPIPEEQSYLKSKLNDLNVTKLNFQKHMICYVALKCLTASLWDAKTKQKHHIFDTKVKVDDFNWLEAQMQFPRGEESKMGDLHANYVIGLWAQDYRLAVDQNLLRFLKYRDEFEYAPDEVEIIESEVKVTNYQQPAASSSNNTVQTPYVTASNITLTQQAASSISNRRRSSTSSRKISYPEETIHLSSDRDEVIQEEVTCTKTESMQLIAPPNPSDFYLKVFRILKRLIFTIEIGAGKIDLANHLELNKNQQRSGDFTQIRMPKIVATSENHYLIICGDLAKSFFYYDPSSKEFSYNISITNLSLHCKESNKIHQILDPLSIISLISFEHKSVKFPVYFAKTIDENEDEKDFINEEEGPDEHFLSDQESVASKSPTDKPAQKKMIHLTKIFPRDTVIQTPSSRKSKKRDEVTVKLHIDIPQIHLFIRKIRTLHNDLNILRSAIQSLSCDPIVEPTTQSIKKDPVQIITCNENSSVINDFLEIDSTFEQPKFNVDPDNVKVHHRFKISIFGQCSIEKVSIELENSSNKTRKKLVFDMEDILSTIDKKPHYFKCTAKLGNLSLNLLPIAAQKGDTPLMDIRMKLLSDNDNSSMLNIVYTAVSIDTLYDKLNIKVRSPRTISQKSVSEIILTIQNIEFIVNLEILSEFLQAPSPIYEWNSLKTQPTEELENDKTLSAADLPILHADCKGISLFVIVQTNEPSCNLSIWKIERIHLSPHLENPLPRHPVRQDVFNKASQLGIISVPGSAIENRQFELTLKNICAFSGNWTLIQQHMRNVAKSTNPAFEWNQQLKYNEVLPLTKIFQKFTIVCIYAPYILYKNILIAGQIIEFNCASDFLAYLNTSQINLINCMMERFKSLKETYSSIALKTALATKCSGAALKIFGSEKMLSTQAPKTRTKKTSKSFTSLASDVTLYYECQEASSCTLPIDIKSDSGYSSKLPKHLSPQQSHQVKLEKTKSSFQYAETPERHLPSSLSLIAGKFIFHFFNKEEKVPGLAFENGDPLMSIGFSEPSFMFKQNVFDSMTQISLFDLVISVANINTYELTEELLSTTPGKPNSSGIPSPLITYKSTITKQKLSEVEIELSKAIIINHKEDHTLRFFDNFLIIQKALYHNPCYNTRPTQAISKGSKIDLLKSRLLNADRLHVLCQRLEFNFTDKKTYAGRLVIGDINANAKFYNRPEKAALKACIGCFYIQTEKQIFLHPVSLKLSLDFIRESWNRLPLILSTLKFNVIHIDLADDLLLQLFDALKGLQKIAIYCSSEYMHYLKQRPSFGDPSPPTSKEYINAIKACACGCVEPNSKDKQKQDEQFYQDDLRAGAFQFVELSSDTVLPLPYQIQIIKKDFGIICWRYPQPRKMRYIRVFPVPMESENPIQIKCRMEYYSELFNRFMYFCDFCLSQNYALDVILPEHEVCATIWRVVILQSLVAVDGECFKMNDDDDELRSIPSYSIDESLCECSSDRDFALHPKVLVACMQVDTTFQPKAIPKVQLLFSCNILLVKLLNKPNDPTKANISYLEGFELKKTTSTNQNFLELMIEKFDFCSTFFSKQFYTLDSSLTLKLKSLDLGFLNMLPIIEPTRIQFYAAIDEVKNRSIANMSIEKMRLNLGPTVLQSLMSSKKHWERFLETTSQSPHYAFMSKCAIVNRTDIPLIFGQTGTNEHIDLNPNSYYFYHFGSEDFPQELTFTLYDEKISPKEISQSVPIPFKFDGHFVSRNIRMGQKCLCLKIKKFFGTQVVVFVKGQIEILSMVAHNLMVQLAYENNLDNQQNNKDYVIKKKSRQSFFQLVHRTTNINLRLKIVTDKGNGRTGDIPLKSNKNLPWLVKVPLEKDNFISFWVRVLREDFDVSSDKYDVGFYPQKILVVIWPVFQIENLLNTPVKVIDSGTKATYGINGKGFTEIIDVPATHNSEHNVLLNVEPPAVAMSPLKYTLMLKALDWHQFFQYSEKDWPIDTAIHRLTKKNPTKWPLDNPEETRIDRKSTSKNVGTITLKTSLSEPFSCSMSLSVKPWGIFINATGLDLTLQNIDTGENLEILSNNLEMMSIIEKAFIIIVKRGHNQYSSVPIFYEKLLQNQNNYKDRSKQLPNSFTTEITILLEDVIVYFVLLYKYENDMRIFKLSSKYVVTNYLDTDFSLIPFAMDHKETSNREELQEFDRKVPKFHIKQKFHEDLRLGLTLDAFFDLKSRSAKRSKDTAFVYFVCLKSSDSGSELSIPISLATPFTRRCLSLQIGFDSIPLTLSLLEVDNIFYLNISLDISPTLLISNRTDVPLIVGQTSASENSQVTNTTAEYEGRHFEWFHLVPAVSRTYYTPPDVSYSFPNGDITMCNLTLAKYRVDATKKTLKWSKPLRTDKTWQKFLHLPGHGDIKIIICDKHRVTRVSIFYVSEQSEFSVKDLRSRITSRNFPQESVQALTSEEVASTSRKCELKRKVETSNQLKDLECEHFRDICVVKTLWKVSLYAKELALNLHVDNEDRDCFKQEIIAMHIDDLAIAYGENEDERQVNVIMSNVQIDNQMHSLGKYDFPVVLCSQTLYERNKRHIHIHDLNQAYEYLLQKNPMARFKIKLYPDEFVVSSIDCKLNPLRVYIEDSFVNDFLDALVEFNLRESVSPLEEKKEKLELGPGETLIPSQVVSQTICLAEPLNLRHFIIEPLNVLLSVHTSLRLYIALDHSPLSFSRYERHNILTMPIRFGQSLGMHYLSGAIFGAGWVVGSLEILGSPSGLARSFTTGLWDFVSMPVTGLFRGPWGFVMGITQGSASLFRNITAGTVNSVTKLASSVARNLDRLSLDREHIERTEALRRSRPQGFTEGFSQGLTGFGISLLGAVGGLAHHTLEAQSTVGVIAGLSKGIVGAITKPISGAAELVALTGQGMLHTVGFNAMPQQIAPADFFKMSSEPSAYRIWKLLPSELVSDQILIYNEVTLVRDRTMKKAYAFLTLAVFAIIEAEWNKLTFALPISKVDIRRDKDDCTLFYVRMMKEPQDDMEERHKYTNERIMNFLQSNEHSMTSNSLHELLRVNQDNSFIHNEDWSFYIDINLGDHLLQYIHIMRTNNVNLNC